MKALVGGGSGGIGGAVCEALADSGFDVAIIYRTNRAAALASAEVVRKKERSASVHRVDLTNAAATAALVGSIDRLDAVVYASGPPLAMLYVSEVSPADFGRQVAEDTVACFNLFQPSIARLRETRGNIVAVVTPAIGRFAARDILSAAPKAAVEQIVRGIAAEEGKYGLRANAVAVGLIEDGLYEDLLSEGDYNDHVLALARRSIPLRRFGRASDVAHAVAFLASPRAAWITGQTLAVDGGYSV